MTVCMHCESNKIIHTRIPEHSRQWKDDENGEEFTEYMPPADDYECADCTRIWTIYDGETP